ncbi:phosphohistidine phosphatase SixA [Rubellicoccus peritrichatus]|uniref:Phosphohistidine phosphatase SixA n=1 Tax=Rubellicoccus peritrichatus TaxID=3080537 RepID=A0AAQ3LAW5_9BACT|nr:phosphohistidine phosphatase SixA [Puniceicoccus sp. CR14]WOO41892.1 phosphohistidine phosphatase SixA [Puniceicoccus sp. CR14]
MRLFLFRHAEATYDAPSDEARELTEKGIKSTKKIAECLKEKEFAGLTEIRHSTLVRARQTAAIFQKEMKTGARICEAERLRPGDNPFELLKGIFEHKGDLMLVGHNPHLTILASILITGDPYSHCIDFKKTGMLSLEMISRPSQDRIAGIWLINWFVVPRLF